jgi:hypothetical protein
VRGVQDQLRQQDLVLALVYLRFVSFAVCYFDSGSVRTMNLHIVETWLMTSRDRVC